MRKYTSDFRQKAIDLRREGKTYSQINQILNSNVPKNTLSSWLRDVPLTNSQKNAIENIRLANLEIARKLAIKSNSARRQRYLDGIDRDYGWLEGSILNRRVALIALSILYSTEGSKSTKGSVMFGNSDPEIIKLFLRILRDNFVLDEKKFRCTVQCRADQNTENLEFYWSDITKIPSKQFYKTQVDNRTIGKPSKKLNYRGVCRINYLSSEIDIRMKTIFQLIVRGL
jgi:hypothetical protein